MTKQFFLKTATLLTALLGAVDSQANMQSHVSLSCLNPFAYRAGSFDTVFKSIPIHLPKS